MATGSKFDLSADSPDGSAFSNAQRGTYATSLMERTGSFRQASDNRFSSLLPSMSRSSSMSSQRDASGLLQYLISDLKGVVIEPRVARLGELRRAISSVVGVSPEDPFPVSINSKLLSFSSVEELKRLRSSIIDNFVKARDRAKVLGEAVSRIDKHGHTLSRKRSRADILSSVRSNSMFPSSGAVKAGLQSHMTTNGAEVAAQKSEERAKSSVPNRRVRTSLVEGKMDGLVSGNGQQPVPDKEGVKHGSSSTESEGRNRVLTSNIDGWENLKMKKKRSVIKSDTPASAILPRQINADRDRKQGVQQKMSNGDRPRFNNAHSFRSELPINSIGSVKVDLATQPSGFSGSLTSNKRDRLSGLGKEDASNKTSIRKNGCEDNCPTSPIHLTKLSSGMRAPRTNAGSLAKSSPNMQRTFGNPDDWENPQIANKVSGSVATTNRKNSSLKTSPPNVARWVGQRPQMSRIARRSNLSPIIPSHSDFAVTDASENSPFGVDGLGSARNCSSITSHTKATSELVSSSVSSENEDIGVPESRSKDKIRKFNEIEEKVTGMVLPLRKNKLAYEEDTGDGVGRQVRIGRGYAHMSSVMPGALEKSESASTKKQIRSARVGSDKIESKSGRPPNKKSERKSLARPRHSTSNTSLDSAGESDDDREELLAAAGAVLATRKAGDNTFWKQMEQIFYFVSADDVAFLNEQSSGTTFPREYVLKDESQYRQLPSNPLLANSEGFNVVTSSASSCRTTVFSDQSKHDDPFLEQLVSGSGPQSGVSICQALLSAIIEEEDIEDLNYQGGKRDGFYTSNTSGYAVSAELDENRLYSVANGFMSNSVWQVHGKEQLSGYLENDIVLPEQSKVRNSFEELMSNHSMSAFTACSEFQYSQMSLSDRIYLELSEIGLYPDLMPDLSQSEDEDITDGINSLEELICEKVKKRKSLLAKLEKSVTECRNLQEKEMEKIALDKLVKAAYDKYMACWGPNASSKHVKKSSKHSAAAFVKRTLARCHKFEQMGINCFSDAVFKDIFSSISSCNGVSGRTSISPDDELMKRIAPLPQHCTIDQKGGLSSQITDNKEPLLPKVKRRELLLDDVVGSTISSSLKSTPGIRNSLHSGTKGKRSGRERESIGGGSRSSAVKIGRPPLSNAKGDRKSKTKPKQQKTTQLSISVNNIVNRVGTGMADNPFSGPKLEEKDELGSRRGPISVAAPLPPTPEASSGEGGPIDLSHLPIPELDTTDFGAQGQDIETWLNIGDDDALQDDDFMGLEIPTDDLADIMMV